MKNIISLFWAVCITLPLLAQQQVRGKINIPDLKGYITLKCDFHIHTVFSDATVWPTARVEEAYREGLDAIALTDHIEYSNRAHTKDIVGIHDRAYEIAQPVAKDKGIILIKGGEITRGMPPGHHNALFLTNSEELVKSDFMDAFRAAKAQNAFIFWNHPHWDWIGHGQPDTTLWWPEHTQLLEQGMMHGIEVVNGGICGGGMGSYCPEAHRWCLEKKLTMLGNTDSHDPIQTEFYIATGKHRTMTLVFARSATLEGIREALFERRTAIYHNEYIIGEEKYLKELFENALEWDVKKNGNKAYITFKNKSDLTFHLKKNSHDPRLIYFRMDTIQPHDVLTVRVWLQDGVTGGDVNFIVENFLVEPNKGMKYTVKI